MENHQSSFNQMIQTQATHTLTAEEFLTSSGLMRRWNAEALAIALKEVLPDAGLDLRRVEQRGAVLKLWIGFPPSHTPSLKPKLGHKLRTLVKRTGKNTLPATTWVWAPQHTVHGKY
jgi:hypothetical protein